MHEEYVRLNAIFDRVGGTKLWRFDFSHFVEHQDQKFPLWIVQAGSIRADASTVIIVGGVHGIERIGSHLCLSLLEKYFELSLWDTAFQEQLKKLRLVFIPLVNPVGLLKQTRSNGNGVDIMRNAPVESAASAPFIGGHRISQTLPWYRGPEGSTEVESQFLIDVVTKHIQTSKTVISLDIHSGFGLQDQIWFPWAYCKDPFPRLDVMQVLLDRFEGLVPGHIYKFEPQSLNYCTHGDIWDYLMLQNKNYRNFLPLTLELGSWIWIKKNPIQMLNIDGFFNPIKAHRMKRIYRRHQGFVDFLTRFAIYYGSNDFSKLKLEHYFQKGLKTWHSNLKKGSDEEPF